MAGKLDRILQEARRLRASDVHIIAGVPPSFRVNGEIILASSAPLSREETCGIVESVLNPTQKQVFENDRALCFSIYDSVAGRIRVTAYYHAGNPELAIRLCTLEVLTARELGLPPIIEEFARKPNGLVLITGPTGVGKTTTMNYMVDMINRERRCKVVTIEDPVEYVHERKKALIIQQEVHTDVLSFSKALVHVLRQDPDVIVIGEMRDLETVGTALMAAETGHLVIATLHTPNVMQSVERIVAVFPPDQQAQVQLQLANCLQGVVAQELLPRAIRIEGDGLVLATETLVVTTAVRNIIRENNLHLLYNAIQTGSQHGMITMDRTLHDLYQKGIITYDVAISRMRDPGQLKKKERTVELA